MAHQQSMSRKMFTTLRALEDVIRGKATDLLPFTQNNSQLNSMHIWKADLSRLRY